MIDKKNPKLIQNTTSIAGVLITLISMTVGLPMMFIDIFAPHDNPYAGIVIYFLLPAATSFGIFLIFAGMLWERRQRRRYPDRYVPPLPKIDLSRPSHRFYLAAAFGVALVSFALLLVTAYRAYTYSDSVRFCGLVCHGVMKPEYVAYKNSPHARVDCVACHIGPGVGWFAKSKISGSYQVYSVTFNKYSRPIKTPVHDLRPAQETCEQCHWPAKFFGAQQKIFNHYLTDEKNTHWQILTLLKTGGGDPATGAPSGIHWHMNINNRIFYVDTDGRREVIPWVRVVSGEGKMTEYMSEENPLTPEELAKHPVRRVDCIDCHNRPSHIFNSPHHALDQAFTVKRLDSSLPYLKREAMRLMAGEYKTEQEAREAIRNGLPEFYKTNYPAIYAKKSAAIEQAVATVQNLFSMNIFPEMKTDWKAHPAHIGHIEFDGCFRCHDGLHKSKDGRVLTNDCESCHTILAQGTPKDVMKVRLQSQPFQHPVDMGLDVTTMKCTTCHSGTTGL